MIFHVHRKCFSSELDTMKCTDQFDIVHRREMTSSYNFKGYLENRLANEASILKTEKFLQEDLNKFASGKTTRADVQNLKRQLVKHRSAKNLLQSKAQNDFICKIRTCESTDYLTKLHAKNGRIQNVGIKNTEEEVIEVKEDNANFVKTKHVEDLSRSGKVYRREKLIRTLQEGDLKLLNSKRSKVNAFEALNFQKEAHMSERDLMKTQKMFKRRTGANMLAGRKLRKSASDETMPAGIVVDDLEASISLQAGLNKASERLIQSNLIPAEQKAILMSEKICTFYCKAGQDGTTGKIYIYMVRGSLTRYFIATIGEKKIAPVKLVKTLPKAMEWG